MEKWKTIPGFEGVYEISDAGNVRCFFSYWGGKMKRLQFPVPVGMGSRRGYKSVALRKGGRRTHYGVHRLVLEAFVGPGADGDQGAHLNGRKDDNRACNLVWAQAKENNDHKKFHGTWPAGEKNGQARLTEEDVRKIRASYTGRYGDLTNLGRAYGVSKHGIFDIVNRRSWGHVA